MAQTSRPRRLFGLMRRAPSVLRNAPLFALTGAVSLTIEVFAAGGILAENHATVTIAGLTVQLGYAEAIMSMCLTLVSLVLAGSAAAQKADPRPSEQKRAGWTQTLAIIVLAAPVFYAGNCLAMNAMERERLAYAGTDQHRADLHASRDPSIASEVLAEINERLGQANPVTHGDLEHLIPCVAWVAFLLGCNMFAVRLGWRAPPETKAQRERRTQPGLKLVA